MEGIRKKVEKVARAAAVVASLTGASAMNTPMPAEAAQTMAKNPYLSDQQESSEVTALMETTKQVYALLGIGRGEGLYSLDNLRQNLQNGNRSMEILGYAAIATGVDAGLRHIISIGNLSQKHSDLVRARQLIQSSSLPEPTKSSVLQRFEEVGVR